MTRVRRRLLALAAVLAVAHISTPRTHGQVPVDPSTDWDPTAADSTRDWSDEVPAHISYATEESWLDREGTVEAMPLNVPLLTGDRLRTGEGRIEVIFSDGSVLSLDRHSDAEFLSDTLLRLDRGAVRLELARGTAGYRIDAAGTTSWARTPGEFIVEVNTTAGVTPAVRLLVVRGTAELESNGSGSLVDAGYEVWASADTTPSLPRAATVAGGGDFARWWDDRRLERTGYQSASYLPSELNSYGGVLESYGDWEYDTDYGQVWYPRVAAEWTPYSTGRWSYVGSYGWTWIGADRWAWPTHHYGRWGHRGSRYYWIPGSHWAPAWVAWASTPGYYGWVPLGFNSRPLISIHIGYSSGWRGWTYHPIDHFRTRVVVVNRGHYLPRRNVRLHHVYAGPTHPAVSIQTTHRGLRGPVRGTVAVPRTAVSRVPGTGLDPRGSRAALGTSTTGVSSSRAPGAITRAPSRAATGAPSRTRAITRTGALPGGVDRAPARAAVGGTRGAGAGGAGAITRAPSRRIDAPRASAAPARSRATVGAPVRGVNRATPPSTVAPTNRAIRRAAPRTIAPGARQPGAVRQAPASRAGASRAPRVIAPRVNRAPTRTAPPTIDRTPARSIRRAPGAMPSRQVEGAGARAPRPRVINRAPTRSIERAPARTIDRTPAPRVERAPASRPARVQAPASRSGSGGGGGGDGAQPSARSRAGGSGEASGRAQARPR